MSFAVVPWPVVIMSPLVVPGFIVPGADLPAWSPWVFGAMGLITLAVLIYQAVRYFRNNDDD